MSRNNFDFQVGIIGGGPAGSTLSSYLSLSGISNVIFEKEKFPRPHVGESLVPAVNRVLNEIGVIDAMDKAGFPKKYGAAWAANSARVYQHDWTDCPEDYKVNIRFDEREMYGNRSYTYHVDRSRFDKILLDHARVKGATIKENVRVKRIKFSDDGHPTILVRENKEESEYNVCLVVDASGRNTVIGNQLKIKKKDPNFDQFAIHGWFEGYDRGENDNHDYIFIYFLPMPNSWMWQIPISETVTSIGVVTQMDNYKHSKKDQNEFFWQCTKMMPDVHNRLVGTKIVKALQQESEYSYAMNQIVGDGWALIGDAARFVDPIFSSGVSIALNSARFLSHDIIEIFSKNSFDYIIKKSDLSRFEKIINKGTKTWYEFISLYYRLNVLFTKFVYNPEHRSDILKLLSGDVYDDEQEDVLLKMKSFVESVEANPNHILYPLLDSINIMPPNAD